MTINHQNGRGDLALVLSGGGARAAYQIGVLRALARRLPDAKFPILTGVSAGAINAVYLASRTIPFRDKVEELHRLWTTLRTADVFRVDSPSLGRTLVRWAMRLVSGGVSGAPQIRGLVDTAPLRALLERVFPLDANGEIDGIARNLRESELKAIAVTTLNYSTGQTITWVQGKDIATWERPSRRSIHDLLSPSHVLASAALPLVFPAVRLDHSWHGDGGIRLAAPLSPALHLGAGRILAMSTRYQRSFDEADTPVIHGYPPPIQVLGHLMNAIFLDIIDQDAWRLEKFNELLEKIPQGERGRFRPVDFLVLRPSQDLGRLAAKYEPSLPRGVRFLFRGLGAKETSSPDFLSLLMFQGDYLTKLIEIGEADGEAQMEKIVELVS